MEGDYCYSFINNSSQSNPIKKEKRKFTKTLDNETGETRLTSAYVTQKGRKKKYEIPKETLNKLMENLSNEEYELVYNKLK